MEADGLDDETIAALTEIFVTRPEALRKALDELSVIIDYELQPVQGAGPGNAPGGPGL
jgi:hypothetical protein